MGQLVILSLTLINTQQKYNKSLLAGTQVRTPITAQQYS